MFIRDLDQLTEESLLENSEIFFGDYLIERIDSTLYVLSKNFKNIEDIKTYLNKINGNK